MRKENNRYIYSPSDLILFMESEVCSWLDRYNLDYKGELSPDPDDEQLKLLQKRGIQHEIDFLQSLKDEGVDVCEIPEGVSDPGRLTLEALQRGADIIYQGVLSHGEFAGKADFLKRVPGASKLGDYHYEVWDTKLALKPKPYFIIQLCCYAEMLEQIQGVRPELVSVVLGNKETHAFRTDDYYFLYQQLKDSFLKLQHNFDRNHMPEPSGMEDFGKWTTHIQRVLEERDHLSRVANIRKVQIQKLAKAGITTMTELAESKVTRIPRMRDDTFSTLMEQAQVQLESAGKDKPVYRLIPQNPVDPRRGLALLPPASSLDVYFDMEGYPHVEGGLEYLFGVTYIDNAEPRFQDWWAHDRQAERIAFERFIDWVFDRFKRDPGMHIYHYASYEVTAMRKLMGRFGTREHEVDEFLRKEVFVDLYSVVRQGLRIGEPKYSIKNVEHLYGPGRSGTVATAADSLVYYQHWLESGEDQDPSRSPILTDIRNYNKDDCDSTWRLTEWLREIQRQNQIAWIPNPAEAEEQEEKPATDATKLAQQLLEQVVLDSSGDPERNRVKELLAYLLEFHWREAKPVHWNMFDRHAMTEEQLYDDINCLAGLTRTARPPETVKKSYLFEYSFDPDQDTKLAPKTRCYFAHDLDERRDTESLDTEKGILTFKQGINRNPPPDRLSLIPDELVPAKVIAQSIYDTVSEFSKTGKMPGALEDFLYRRRPRIDGNTTGPIVTEQQGMPHDAITPVSKLHNSTLCIQGPPGTGKTYTAAHIILALVASGKRVGVTSNSNKAILNLLTSVIEEGSKKGQSVSLVKIGDPGKEGDDRLFQNPHARLVQKVTDVFPTTAPELLIGGTAWKFSDPSATEQLDYLFVDEAGQVSIANLVGMSRSTKNIVLIGDQMQLSQPIQGSHPGESGKSLLEYLLDGKPTIPPDFGIFLGLTRRLHPEVCNFISGAVYQGRLQPHPVTGNRVLLIPPDAEKQITRRSGIQFVPVPHQGNTQGSDEEADQVSQLVRALLACKVMNDDGTTQRQLTIDDIVIVAPYNMQVRKIRDRLPRARVGSVDKFQGQEAPVVIVSMCASDAESSARGMDFLFDKSRLNVAISRAQTLAIVVASPALADAKCGSVAQMELANMFCRILEAGR